MGGKCPNAPNECRDYSFPMVPKTTTIVFLVESQVINNVKNASKIHYRGLEIMHIKMLNLCFREKLFLVGKENSESKYEDHSFVIMKIIAF